MYVNELIDSQFTLYMGELERELEKKEAFEFQKLKKKKKKNENGQKRISGKKSKFLKKFDEKFKKNLK